MNCAVKGYTKEAVRAYTKKREGPSVNNHFVIARREGSVQLSEMKLLPGPALFSKGNSLIIDCFESIKKDINLF